MKKVIIGRRTETKLWTTESKQYFSTLKEAKMKAEYCNTPWSRFNGIHYDAEKKMYYVSYINKY